MKDSYYVPPEPQEYQSAIVYLGQRQFLLVPIAKRITFSTNPSYQSYSFTGNSIDGLDALDRRYETEIEISCEGAQIVEFDDGVPMVTMYEAMFPQENGKAWIGTGAFDSFIEAISRHKYDPVKGDEKVKTLYRVTVYDPEAEEVVFSTFRVGKSEEGAATSVYVEAVQEGKTDVEFDDLDFLTESVGHVRKAEDL